MNKPTRKQLILIIAGIVIIGFIIYGFLPDAVPVETATATTDSLQVMVEEEGKTHVKQHYTISSPVAGIIQRIEWHEGDQVASGDPLAKLEPPRSTILDPRSQAEASARVDAAEASLQEAESRAEQATSERKRIERLAEGGSATQRQLEQARTEANRATAALNAARAELAAARAVAYSGATETHTNHDFTEGYVVRAPVSGRILAIHHKSASYINAGEPIIDIGNTDSLEIRVDVLSEDAVRIAPGTRVLLEQWGGEKPLEARVSRVERQGKVEVSALGVEEQRVQVVADLQSPHEQWKQLGSGYRVLARFVIWEEADVLQVPASALFRTGEGWAVFVASGGEAHRQKVKVGRQTGLSVQILEGISEGDRVIVHPGSKIEDGVRVEVQ